MVFLSCNDLSSQKLQLKAVYLVVYFLKQYIRDHASSDWEGPEHHISLCPHQQLFFKKKYIYIYIYLNIAEAAKTKQRPVSHFVIL